jgi:hypothetical protein
VRLKLEELRPERRHGFVRRSPNLHRDGRVCFVVGEVNAKVAFLGIPPFSFAEFTSIMQADCCLDDLSQLDFDLMLFRKWTPVEEG